MLLEEAERRIDAPRGHPQLVQLLGIMPEARSGLMGEPGCEQAMQLRQGRLAGRERPHRLEAQGGTLRGDRGLCLVGAALDGALTGAGDDFAHRSREPHRDHRSVTKAAAQQYQGKLTLRKPLTYDSRPRAAGPARGASKSCP